MGKSYEQKRQELAKRFEQKKTNFLTTLFSLTKDLQDDLNILGVQYQEINAKEIEEKDSETTKETEATEVEPKKKKDKTNK